MSSGAKVRSKATRAALKDVDGVLAQAGGLATGLAREVAHALLEAGRLQQVRGVIGPAQALGTLRAQEGHGSLTLVDELVRLRDGVAALGEDPALSPALMRAADEALRHAVSAFHDEAIRVLGAAATRDPLTGLANRLVFEDALERAVARPAAPGPTLVVFDLDNFKALNDLRGHLAGDEALVAFAEVLRAAVRPGDTAARLGGDEFVVLLPSADCAEACQVATRIIAKVSKRRELRDPEATLGVSAGAAALLPGHGSQELLSRADAAMYDAKQSGGNQVKAAGSGAITSHAVGTDPDAATSGRQPLAADQQAAVAGTRRRLPRWR